MNDSTRHEFLEATHSRQPVAGLTHSFYRYPARFSPLFARAAIKAFSDPGDVILDPFMGGGTTLVEARALGRRAIGADINALAVFVSKVKTTVLSNDALDEVGDWLSQVVSSISLRQSTSEQRTWSESGYLRNIADRSTWPIRKFVQLSLDRLDELSAVTRQHFARCVLLRTAQWAFDCRREIPNIDGFRQHLVKYWNEMAVGAREYASAVRTADRLHYLKGPHRTVCISRSAAGIEMEPRLNNIRPRLILTSPPYPGVHVLYHRWQIQGRKETPAPFWITNTLDGKGASFYNFGDRKQEGLVDYYEQAFAAFTSLARISDSQTLVVQLVAFSEPSWQLPEYLRTMEKAGFRETRIPNLSNSDDGRLWRRVPNRKWYTHQQRAYATSKEVVLFHRPA